MRNAEFGMQDETDTISLNPSHSAFLMKLIMDCAEAVWMVA
jgi:hypothetical protein